MPVQLFVVLAMLFTLAGCYPEKECAGELVFDETTALCFECPTGAKYKNETCECPEGYAFIALKCVLMDGAMPPTPDAGQSADAAASEGRGCKDYCTFATRCVGGNTVAKGFLTDIVTGLHADDAQACESSCKSDVGSAEATDPAVACFSAGQEAVMCADPVPAMTGLEATFGFIGQCCEPNPDSELCKSICKTLKANPAVASEIGYCG